MSTRAQLNYASLIEGHCWQCGGRLERILDWAECIPCGRRFTIKGRRVTEQIAILPDMMGKRVWIGGDVLLKDGAAWPVIRVTSAIGPDCEWIVCEWELA